MLKRAAEPAEALKDFRTIVTRQHDAELDLEIDLKATMRSLIYN